MMDVLALQLLVFFTLGALLGYVHLAALGLNVRLYLVGVSRWFALLVHSTRLLAIVAAFTFCAHRSALALISSVAGFQIMRTVALHRQTQAFERKS
jgi:F1F0 ATPase subunit 2